MKRIITAIIGLSVSIAAIGCIQVPPGTTVLVTDSPEALCEVRVNCYHAPTRTIVILPGQSLRVLAHEGCHAHQHWSVLEEGETASIDLHEWYDTAEAREYAAIATAPRPTDWRLSADTLLEDFAESCARFMTQMSNESGREAFFAERDFR
jgi:hypothetical protein